MGGVAMPSTMKALSGKDLWLAVKVKGLLWVAERSVSLSRGFSDIATTAVLKAMGALLDDSDR